MKLALTKPLEKFVQQQITKGYSGPNEVVRQALLRWMSEESKTPPRVQEKLDAAALGRFKRGSRTAIKRIIASAG
jgi:Arc/MetJ-type ribon-helix-helix transcriptional regulator